MVRKHLFRAVLVKTRLNDRNMRTQHIATLLSQQQPTYRNTSQHGGQTRTAQHVAPKRVAICYIGMLRSFGQGLKETRHGWCVLCIPSAVESRLVKVNGR